MSPTEALERDSPEALREALLRDLYEVAVAEATRDAIDASVSTSSALISGRATNDRPRA